MKCQLYEHDQKKLNITKSLDVTLGPNPQQDMKIFNLIKTNNNDNILYHKKIIQRSYTNMMTMEFNPYL